MNKKKEAYLYGFTLADCSIPEDCPGIGDPELKVYLVPHSGLSVILSYLPENYLDFNLEFEDTIKHAKVLETIMKNAPVIPIKFGTMTTSLEELKKYVHLRKKKLLEQLQQLQGKFEVGLKAYWKKDYVNANLAKRYKDHHSLVAQAQKEQDAAIELGQRVEMLIEELRAVFHHEVHPYLSRAAEDNCINAASSPEMLYNAAFLVHTDQEPNLRKRIFEIGDKYQEQMELHYTTHLPPYNFINLDGSKEG